MAAITGSNDPIIDTPGITKTQRPVGGLDSVWREEWTPIALTAAVIIAAAAALGTMWIGIVVSGLFLAGNAIVALEGRSLRVDEFAAIASLHAAAAVVLSLSL